MEAQDKGAPKTGGGGGGASKAKGSIGTQKDSAGALPLTSVAY